MSGNAVDGPGGCRVFVEDALCDFAEFLTAVKGVAVATRECYLRHVRTFLTGLADPMGVIDLKGYPDHGSNLRV